jgi:hypothetical protein
VKGFGFQVFCQKKLALTEPDFGLVWLISHKINITRFDWFFESKPNRTTPLHLSIGFFFHIYFKFQSIKYYKSLIGNDKYVCYGKEMIMKK